MNLTNQEFQELVDSMLIRHQSILDILSKGQEASCRVNRAVIKAVTACGCINVNAKKPTIPEDTTLAELKYLFSSHLNGKLCSNCRETVEMELGNQMFYIAALVNTLGLSLSDVLEKEKERLNTLTVYNLK
ncbi:MAG: DUF1573 domain-containing protein [Peptococcaceae bacterium]|nr:DUF1573 domain-containing protein [Peptococcaceae bacterium]